MTSGAHQLWPPMANLTAMNAAMTELAREIDRLEGKRSLTEKRLFRAGAEQTLERDQTTQALVQACEMAATIAHNFVVLQKLFAVELSPQPVAFGRCAEAFHAEAGKLAEVAAKKVDELETEIPRLEAAKILADNA